MQKGTKQVEENNTISNDKEKNNSKKYLRWFCIIAVVVLLLFVGYGFLMFNCDERGTFGDMFGAVSALFSGLAFAGVIITMLQQSETLKLQRQDLNKQIEAINLQKQEMAQTNKELQEQNKTILLQRFENTFFGMLRQQQEILLSIEHTETSKSIGRQTTTGREAMINDYNTLEVLMEGDFFYRQNPTLEFGTVLDNSQMWSNFSLHLEPYFRYVCQIMKFVDDSQFLTDAEKYNYSSIFRSQLSSHELLLLFYFGITNEGKKEFKAFVEKYALMQNIRKDLLMGESHNGYYSPEAYCHQ